MLEVVDRHIEAGVVDSYSYLLLKVLPGAPEMIEEFSANQLADVEMGKILVFLFPYEVRMRRRGSNLV